jgi:hypothetical protein
MAAVPAPKPPALDLFRVNATEECVWMHVWMLMLQRMQGYMLAISLFMLCFDCVCGGGFFSPSSLDLLFRKAQLHVGNGQVVPAPQQRAAAAVAADVGDAAQQPARAIGVCDHQAADGRHDQRAHAPGRRLPHPRPRRPADGALHLARCLHGTVPRGPPRGALAAFFWRNFFLTAHQTPPCQHNTRRYGHSEKPWARKRCGG